MLQKGVQPGSTTPAAVDNLAYTYASYSNKLLKVTDNGTLANENGSFGDFKDGTNGTTDDYIYDSNGNLIVDLNKNVVAAAGGGGGITYNFLDKPELMKITGKGTIKIVYDAEGNKLQKTYTPENGTAAVTTTYVNQFVYKGASLQYINFEEGRIRVMQPVSWNNGYDGATIDGNITLPANKEGVFDYFIRDYQENVRMILTEETHYSVNLCTMEAARAANEKPYFGQAGSANGVATTQFAKPAGWQSNTTGSVSKLSKLSGHTIGPNSLLKVMAGDVLNAKTDYYYQSPVINNSNSLVTDVVNNLIMAISGSAATGASVKGGASGISTNLSGSVPLANTADPNRYATDNLPRAYLNVLFFDERFNFVAENSTAVRVSQSGDGAAPLVLANVKAPKNGYVYVYVSNENDQAVYFDNFQVSDNRGRIIEENHYYAFGLKIAAISSTKLPDPNEGNINNKNLYNDKELIDEADLNWYDYGYRNYDPQIGRFPQLDPLTWDYPELTNYQYAGNEPIANVDVDGLEPWNVLQTVVVTGHKTVQAAKTGLSVARIGSIAAKTADIATDFIPIVSGSKDIYSGIKSGNGWQVALGVGSIALDVFTFGGSSITKGFIKTGIREGVEMLAKEEAKELAVKVAKGGTNVVYEGLDKAGIVKYVGITKRTPAVRFGEHLKSIGTGKELLNYRVVPGATNLSRIDARIGEQTLINKHGLKNLLNVRNSIAPEHWWKYGMNP